MIIYCLDCGKPEESKSKRKLYCRECSQRRNRERTRKHYEEVLKKNTRIKKALKKPDPQKQKQEERLSRDAEIDARSRKQIQLQCRKCKYQLRVGCASQMRCIGCDYISWKGHSTDKGNGPGDCRSFEPMEKKTAAERNKRRRKALTISEADHAQNTGEKMREVNQL